MRVDALSTAEEDFYKSLYLQSQAEFSTYVASGTLMHNYGHVFDLLSSLRQACNHPYLVLLSKNLSVSATNWSTPSNASDVCGDVCGKTGGHLRQMKMAFEMKMAWEEAREPNRKCCICKTVMGQTEGRDSVDEGDGSIDESTLKPSTYVVAKCGHNFHRSCVEKLLCWTSEDVPGDVSHVSHVTAAPERGLGQGSVARGAEVAGGEGVVGAARDEVPRCPACGEALSVDMRARPSGFERGKRNRGIGGVGRRKRSLLRQFEGKSLPTSTKLEAVAAEVKKMMSSNNMSKVVIFSQYTRMLDLVTLRLSGDGIGVSRVSGDMTRQDRDANLKAFREDRERRVIMISLKAGGEGLNLQVHLLN